VEFFNIFRKILPKSGKISSKFSVVYKRVFQFLTNKLKPQRSGQMDELDKKLVLKMNNSRIPNWRQLKYIKKVLSRGELLTIRISLAVILLSAVSFGSYVYFSNLQLVPVAGGVYREALIGSPSYINPLYAGVSDVDNDLSQLVFSSLFTRGQNGELEPDLAEEYFVNEDNKIYTIRLRSDALWHDGTAVSADDVVFTFNAISDSELKSPLRSSFAGVSVERLGDNRLRFILTDPYAAFLDLLTFGIMPSHLWSQVQPETFTLASLNLKPIGSGPYRFKRLIRDNDSGQIRSYELEANSDYYGQIPFVDLTFNFYPNFQEAIVALNDGLVDGMSYLPLAYQPELLTPKAYNYHRLYLPQLTAIFFNQNRNEALKDKSVRQALAYGLDRDRIISETLDGNAYVVDSPILSNSFAYKADIKKYSFDQAKARQLLSEAGWEPFEIGPEAVAAARELVAAGDEEAEGYSEAQLTEVMGEGSWLKKEDKYLIIHLVSVDRNENAEVLEMVRQYWEQLGIKTAVDILPVNRIQSEVIIPRNFDALFYGQIIGADPDPYPFWHSSQTGERGYNIANYADKGVDKILEDARLNSDRGERQKLYWQFQDIIAEEVPALFMYSPVYTYLQSNDIKGFDVNSILIPRDRFANVADWYLKTAKKLVFEDQ
jgi:peptide/nickel transport system substrate-binding protein